MTCRWGKLNCKEEGVSCDRCLTNSFFYNPKSIPKKMSARRVNKKDRRMGSRFEYANHQQNEAAISSMTINSGATAREKGDEKIRGIIEVMEELKTQMPNRKGGVKSFSIQRKWLDKLHAEANQEGKEFWYLKFAFDEEEGVAGNSFVVVEQDIIMSMICTMVRDRKKALEVDAKLKLYKARYVEEQAKANALSAELQTIKAKIDYAKARAKADDLFSI